MSEAMVTSFSLQKKDNNFEDSSSFDLQSFCQLQCEQLTNHYPIFFARIVYHNFLSNLHEEVISYAEAQYPFSHNTLAYLRSEEWLIDYPPVFTFSEIKLKDFQSFSYIISLGYKDQKPEYIQLISHQPLSSSLQKYVKLTVMLLSKYINLFIENGRQKSQIKLLEEVLHRVSHQLRNSIGMIGLHAHNLYFKLQNNPLQEQAIVIGNSIQDLDTNLTQLLDCGQSSKLRIALQDLRSVLAESINSLQPYVNQKQLKICIPVTSTTLAIDRLQMKQVFDNILSNAVHFSPYLGTITCSWQIFQGEILIKISDQGPGLSQEELKKIFTPFYSRRPGGTGLGLTIAKKIVLDHQGSLWAHNLAEGGAQFSIILPR
ncbi:MAG: HAMP domain-containing sensor histidine kinase [Scytonema sp. PMC 1070.18]|nr:HAMP domain-containing sensor histidine kinase [Scytonema sp. PMC 1070.18]